MSKRTSSSRSSLDVQQQLQQQQQNQEELKDSGYVPPTDYTFGVQQHSSPMIQYESEDRKRQHDYFQRSHEPMEHPSSSHPSSSKQSRKSSIRIMPQNEDQDLNEEEQHLIKLIVQGMEQELRMFLRSVSMDLTRVWDPAGFNLLHLAAYKNSLTMVQILCQYVLYEERINSQRQDYSESQILNPQNKLAQWINQQAIGDESFTALHFAAFNGNVDLLQYLVQMGGDVDLIHRKSASQVSLFHVAAQGDQISTLAYIKKLMETSDPQIVMKRDCKQATPLHWACYAGSENAVQYLLAWGADPNAQDQFGITPLHLAVKAAEELKNPRTVRQLLIKGAERNITDNQGRKPIDIAYECRSQSIKKELSSMLAEPNMLQKCMIQTPLKKVPRSANSVTMFILLYLISFLYLLYFIFPGMPQQPQQLPQDFTSDLNVKILISCNFIVTTVFFLLSWLTDPGYLKPNPEIDFVSVIPRFDPSQLCPDCGLIKTKRCRHCPVCNRCVERHDHHCPWINNCVGYRNHGYFYIYLISLQIYLLTFFYVISMKLKVNISAQGVNLYTFRQTDLFTAIVTALSGSMQPSEATNKVLMFNIFSLGLLLLCVIFMVPLLILVCVQTKNMISNETTSERFSKRRDKEDSARSSQTALTHPEMFPEEQERSQNGQEDDKLDYYRLMEDREDYRQKDFITKTANNCMLMTCAHQYETQEELLQRKFNNV